MSWSAVEGALSIANSSLLFNSFSRKTCWHDGRNPLLAPAIVLIATIMVKAILLRPFPHCLAKKWSIAAQPNLHCLPLRKLMPGTMDNAGSRNVYNVSASPARAAGAREVAHARKRRGRACEKVSPPTTTSSAPGGDKFFPDFCAAFGQPQSHVRVERLTPSVPSVGRGCVSIADDMVTGAAKGSFCLGSTGWRQWCSALYFLSRIAVPS
jgi:hypothetical protein